jgi:putative ABC transport system permease protein
MPERMRDWRQEVRTRLDDLRVDPTRHASIVEEVAQHLDERYRGLLASGLPPADADAAVMDELRDAERLRRGVQHVERRAQQQPIVPGGSAARHSWIDTLWQDVRYGARTLWRAPAFSIVAVLTLAVGVGATTAIFAVVNAVVLRPLPYADSERLVRLWESNPARGWPTFSASHPNFLDWQAQARSFSGLAAAANAGFTLSEGGSAEIVRAFAASAEFLPVLGVTPAIGRSFRPEEDRPGGNTRVVLIAHSFWQRRFDGDPSAVGRTVTLDNVPYAIVGVLPESFGIAGVRPDVIVPLAPDPARARGDHRLVVVGRLRPGVTIDEARTEMQMIAARLAQQFPSSNGGWSVLIRSFYEWLVPPETSRSLAIMMGAVLMVLLIACGNAASLLLARASARQREFAIRSAVGAERARIVQQWLIEALLLGVMAAAAGIGLAWLTTRIVVYGSPTVLPRLDELSIDVSVVWFGIVTSLTASALFGLAPALQASRDPGSLLKDGARGASGGRARQRVRAALVIAEVALSVSLLIGAGLLIRSFWRVQQVHPGFDIDQTVTMRITLPRSTYDTPPKSRQFYERLLERISTTPGVMAVATSSGVPLTTGNTSTELTVPGRTPPDGAQASATWRNVSPGYFKALGIPLRGRDFEPADSPADGSPHRNVTIVSEELARRYWPNEDALGKTLIIHSFRREPFTVIGVAGNVRSFGLETDAPPMVYGSALTFSQWNPMSLVVRSQGDPGSPVPAIRAAVRDIDPGVPVYEVRLLTELLDSSMGARRFNMYLLGCFAATALALACVGLFSVLAYLVSQRTRDIGIRMALGATRRDVFRLVLGQGFTLAGIGCVLGIAGGAAAGRVLRGLLFSVGQTDPVTFAVMPLLLLGIALLACYAPARRAMRVDPLVALRAE